MKLASGFIFSWLYAKWCNTVCNDWTRWIIWSLEFREKRERKTEKIGTAGRAPKYKKCWIKHIHKQECA